MQQAATTGPWYQHTQNVSSRDRVTIDPHVGRCSQASTCVGTLRHAFQHWCRQPGTLLAARYTFRCTGIGCSYA
eukprot:355138-Rhodomonas_salina.1